MTSSPGRLTKAQSSVTAPFEYKCRTGTARTFGISHPLSAHSWGADCTFISSVLFITVLPP